MPVPLEDERERLREPEHAIKTAHQALKDYQVKRERYQEMYAAGLMDIEKLKEKIHALDDAKTKTERELEKLGRSEERIKHLEYLKENAFSLEAIAYMRSQKDDREMLTDLYRDLELRVTLGRAGSGEIKGVLGSQNMSNTSTSATRR